LNAVAAPPVSPPPPPKLGVAKSSTSVASAPNSGSTESATVAFPVGRVPTSVSVSRPGMAV